MSQSSVTCIFKVLDVARDEQDLTWEKLTEAQRNKASQIHLFIKPALERVASGVKARPAAEHLHAQFIDDYAPEYSIDKAKELGKGKIPSWQSINRWIKSYGENGLMGLVPKYKGSKRKVQGWESRVHYYLRMGSKNNPGNITKMLQQEGLNVQYHQIKSYVDSLPSNEGMHNRGRLGELKYDSTMRTYVRRKTDELPIGSCYQSDGNMMPIYLEHPTGNRPARFEITPVIDVASRYLAGYYLSESESAESTVHALTDAIVKEDHVPVDFQSDNGPGFKNKRMQRFYLQLGMFEAHPRARNPKDNGYIERWHAIMKDELLKKFPGYCGKDAAPEQLKAYLAKVDKGEIKLMTLEQFREQLDTYINWYNHKRKHGELAGKTPADLWGTLQKNAPVNINDAFYWDQIERTVSRTSVRFETREYSSPELMQYNKKKVLIDFNPYDDSYVKVRELNERWICDAKKINHVPYRSNSVMEDRLKKSQEKKRERVLLKLEEVESRFALAIPHDQNLDAIEEMNEGLLVSNTTGTEVPVDIKDGLQTENDVIDFNDTSYLDE